MNALRRFRTESSPLLLVIVWAVVHAVAILAPSALPGTRAFEAGDARGALYTTVFFGIFLFFGVLLAWWLILCADAIAVAVALVAFADDPHPTPLLVGALYAFAFWLIWAGAVEDYMHGDRRPRAARLH